MAGLTRVLKHSQTFLPNFRNNWSPNCVGFATSVESKLGLDKPKRPVSSFLKFLNQVRPTLVSKNPGVGAVGIVKLASKHWEQLSEEAKEKMSKECGKEMEEYKKKIDKFEKSLTEEQKENIYKLKEKKIEMKEKRRVKAELKDLGRPKRPLTSFILYVQSQRDKVKGENLCDTTSKIAEKWRNLPAQDKAVYEKKSHELIEAYNKELAQWEQKMIRMGNIDYVRNKALMPGKQTKSKNTHSE